MDEVKAASLVEMSVDRMVRMMDYSLVSSLAEMKAASLAEETDDPMVRMTESLSAGS